MVLLSNMNKIYSELINQANPYSFNSTFFFLSL